MANASRKRQLIHRGWPLAAAVLLAACGGKSPPDTAKVPPSPAQSEPAKLLIIGQDLGAIRGYMHSNCCAVPDALTAYVDFYDILTPGDFGGLGIDGDGNSLAIEFSWGAGPVGVLETATEFGVSDVAIGLSITENEHPGGLQRLIDGEYDAEIRQIALLASMIDGQIYLRIGYEFDGAWNQGYEDAEKYIAGYRRIVDVLRQESASNIQYVLQASTAGVDEIIDNGHEDISRWYPGDDYVDWMGLSWFMHPDERSIVETDFEPMTPGELTEELLAFARQKNKPVMIAEASPQGFDINENFSANHTEIWDGEPTSDRVELSDDEIWNQWYAPMFELMETNRDIINALAYINADWDSQEMWGPPYANGFWGDTRLETNPELARRFNAAIEDWKSRR